MINIQTIVDILKKHYQEDPAHIREVLAKARETKGLSLEDVSALISIKNDVLLQELNILFPDNDERLPAMHRSHTQLLFQDAGDQK